MADSSWRRAASSFDTCMVVECSSRNHTSVSLITGACEGQRATLTVMETEWYVGTIKDRLPDESGEHDPLFDLAVPISEEEHRALREAERVVREAERGVIFRLVFANHQALKVHEAQMLDLLTRPDRRGFEWLPEEHLQTTLALANWLTSVRWLLDHTAKRLAHETQKLKQFDDARQREHFDHFAYRFTYDLRDYATHCDLPPISMKVESTAVGADKRTDSLNMQLDPGYLLSTWNGWYPRVKSDLMAHSEPIDLIPLVDDAMACVERIMKAILVAESPDILRAAQLIIDAVKRLPEDAAENDAAPMLFEAQIDGENIRNLSPTPLPITSARAMLGAAAPQNLN